jgi:cyclomaltodextrinase
MSRIFFLVAGILLFSSCIDRKEGTSQEIDSDQLVQYPTWIKDAIIYEVNIRQFTPEGTFSAFEAHIPRLKNLGVDIIWLMPVHTIGELNRRGTLGSQYVVQDYFQLNEAFGTEEDFLHLVESAHAKGIRVLLDWVPDQMAWGNPLSIDHPDWYLQDEKGAFVSPVDNSRQDIIAMNYENSDLRAYMIEAMRYWLKRYDIDGFRCNNAGELPTGFWLEARRELNKTKQVLMLAGWEGIEIHQAFEMSYADELEQRMQLIYQGREDATSISQYLNQVLKTYPQEFIKMNFTSHHELNSNQGTVFDRFGKSAEVFAVMTYLVEGMPMIYSGQEVGLKKQLKMFDKDTIPWGDHPFNAMYDRLGKLKKDNEALWNGHWGGRLHMIPNNAENQIVSFIRQKGDNTVVAILNLSDQSVDFQLQEPQFDGSYRRFKSRDRSVLVAGETMKLPPWGYEVYIQ